MSKLSSIDKKNLSKNDIIIFNILEKLEKDDFITISKVKTEKNYYKIERINSKLFYIRIIEKGKYSNSKSTFRAIVKVFDRKYLSYFRNRAKNAVHEKFDNYESFTINFYSNKGFYKSVISLLKDVLQTYYSDPDKYKITKNKNKFLETNKKNNNTNINHFKNYFVKKLYQLLLRIYVEPEINYLKLCKDLDKNYDKNVFKYINYVESINIPDWTKKLIKNTYFIYDYIGRIQSLDRLIFCCYEKMTDIFELKTFDTIEVTFPNIPYSHTLDNYEGLCHNIHGHNGKLIVTLTTTKINKETGFICDFKLIKKHISKLIKKYYDHKIMLPISDKEAKLYINHKKEFFRLYRSRENDKNNYILELKQSLKMFDLPTFNIIPKEYTTTEYMVKYSLLPDILEVLVLNKIIKERQSYTLKITFFESHNNSYSVEIPYLSI